MAEDDKAINFSEEEISNLRKMQQECLETFNSAVKIEKKHLAQGNGRSFEVGAAQRTAKSTAAYGYAFITKMLHDI